MTRFPLLTAAAVATMALTACGGVQATSSNSAPAGSNQGTAASAPSDAGTASQLDATEPSDGATEDAVAAFGKAYSWEDGLAVTVSTPRAYKPSEYAAGTDKFTKFVSFEVRVVNKTGKAWDPTLFQTSVQSNNQEADEVFDSENLGEMPQTKLLNGREAKFTVAYGVANPQDLVMEVTPDYEHEPVLFQK